MRVEIIGHTIRYGAPDGPFAYGTSAECLLEEAGRVSYNTKSFGSPGKFIRARIKDGHESIIEHATITFLISDISRACSHQLVRHRIASYTQESQRYVEHEDESYVIPPTIIGNEKALALFDRELALIDMTYKALRSLGIPKEDARFILPSAAKTSIVVTMNLRSLRHFFETRCSKDAQWEIRRLAMEMLRLSMLIAPAVFDDLAKEFIGG